MKDYIMKNRIYFMISTVVLVLLWKLIAVYVDSSIIIPSPEETLMNLVLIVRAPEFIPSVINTLIRATIGFSISLFTALVLGVISAWIKVIYILLKPVVLLQKSLPTMSIILLAIIWLDSEKAPIIVSFLVIFPIIYSAVVSGIRGIDPKILEMASVYQLSFYKKLRHIYLPSLRTSLFAVASLALGLNLKITIAAEVLSQPHISIGTNFQIEKSTLNTAGVFAWSLIAVILAGSFDYLLKVIEKRSSHG